MNRGRSTTIRCAEGSECRNQARRLHCCDDKDTGLGTIMMSQREWANAPTASDSIESLPNLVRVPANLPQSSRVASGVRASMGRSKSASLVAQGLEMGSKSEDATGCDVLRHQVRQYRDLKKSADEAEANAGEERGRSKLTKEVTSAQRGESASLPGKAQRAILCMPFISGFVRCILAIVGWYFRESLSPTQVTAWEAICSLLVVECLHILIFNIHGMVFFPLNDDRQSRERARAVLVGIALDSVFLLWVITCFRFWDRVVWVDLIGF